MNKTIVYRKKFCYFNIFYPFTIVKQFFQYKITILIFLTNLIRYVVSKNWVENEILLFKIADILIRIRFDTGNSHITYSKNHFLPTHFPIF